MEFEFLRNKIRNYHCCIFARADSHHHDLSSQQQTGSSIIPSTHTHTRLSPKSPQRQGLACFRRQQYEHRPPFLISYSSCSSISLLASRGISFPFFLGRYTPGKNSLGYCLLRPFTSAMTSHILRPWHVSRRPRNTWCKPQKHITHIIALLQATQQATGHRTISYDHGYYSTRYTTTGGAEK